MFKKIENIGFHLDSYLNFGLVNFSQLVLRFDHKIEKVKLIIL